MLVDVQSVAQIHELAIDPRGDKVYFGYVNPLIDSLFPGAIGLMNLDGSELETIVVGLSEPWGIAVDPEAGKVYWTDVLLSHGGLIRRADLDGANREDLVDGLKEPRGIAIDTRSAQMYWVDAGLNKIQRSQTTGLGVVDVFSGLDRPQSVTLSIPSAILSGDFDPDAVISMIDATFGKIPAKQLKPYVPSMEKPITTPVVKDVLGPDAESVTIGFRLGGARTSDADMLTLLSELLSNGTAGLIDLNLNQEQKVLPNVD